MRPNKRTDERVAKYFSLYSWLFLTIVHLVLWSRTTKNPDVDSFSHSFTRTTPSFAGSAQVAATRQSFISSLIHFLPGGKVNHYIHRSCDIQPVLHHSTLSSWPACWNISKSCVSLKEEAILRCLVRLRLASASVTVFISLTS